MDHAAAACTPLAPSCLPYFDLFPRASPFPCARYDGYRLTYLGYDYLAIKALVNRGAIAGVGRQVGWPAEGQLRDLQEPRGALCARRAAAASSRRPPSLSCAVQLPRRSCCGLPQRVPCAA